jgi:hypothetical protein
MLGPQLYEGSFSLEIHPLLSQIPQSMEEDIQLGQKV